MATLNVNKADFVKSAAAPAQFIHSSVPTVAFAGKSNVGKSSVINRMLNRKNFARVGAQPGKTVHVNYFLIDGKLYFVDLPGYGFAKVSQAERDRWGKLMEDFFAPLRGGGQQAGQAEKERDRAESGLHPGNAGAAGVCAADPLLCGEGTGTGAAPGGDHEPVMKKYKNATVFSVTFLYFFSFFGKITVLWG